MKDYEEDWLLPLLFHRGGSVYFKACWFAIPSTLLTLLFLVLQDVYPEFREKYQLMDLNGSTMWSVFFSGLAFMIGFRTNLAMNRFWEGSGLLHQMRAEWFDTVSNCVTFSIHASEDNFMKKVEFRHTLVRLMSLAHGTALEEISGDKFQLDTIDVMGLNKETLIYLKNGYELYNFNKVEMCVHLVQSLITDALQTNVVKVPAPIVSRVYQTLSRGFVNLLDAKKIKDTRFPFPYSQLIIWALTLLSVLTPLLISCFSLHKGVAALATFAPVFVLSGLNYTAMELENPFGNDDNDLPLEEFQTEMDGCLLMLLHPSMDIIPTVRGNATYDFEELYAAYRLRGEKEEDVKSRFDLREALRTSTSFSGSCNTSTSSDDQQEDTTKVDRSSARHDTNNSIHSPSPSPCPSPTSRRSGKRPTWSGQLARSASRISQELDASEADPNRSNRRSWLETESTLSRDTSSQDQSPVAGGNRREDKTLKAHGKYISPARIQGCRSASEGEELERQWTDENPCAAEGEELEDAISI